MEENIVKTEGGANISMKFDEDLEARFFDVEIKIEEEDLDIIEHSLMECDDFKIKEDSDIGSTVLLKTAVQYKNSDTPENPQKKQPKQQKHSKHKMTKREKKPKRLHTCSTCGETFTETWYLKRHQQTHRRKLTLRKLLKAMCPHCSEEFNNTDEYNRHLREYHKELQFKCDNCLKTFDRKILLKQHRCGESEDKKTKLTDKSKVLKCPLCPVEFTFLGNYNRHIKEFHNKQTFKCTICDKEFKRLYSLKRHQESGVRCNIGTGKRKCLSCGKNFSHKSNFHRHKTGYCDGQTYEGVFICDICDKGFPNRTRLMAHIGHHKRLKKLIVPSKY